MIKISIITATLNSIKYLPDLLESINQQSYTNFEHIVIDGGSTDGTVEFLQSSKQVNYIISEPDDGLYDALNKGVKISNGQVIGFLHSDDLFASCNTLQHIRDAFANSYTTLGEEKKIDVVYGDLVYTDPLDTNKVLRSWISRPFKSALLSRGWMPAHPTLFMNRKVYMEHGLFDANLKIAADYDMIIRVFKDHFINSIYIPKVITKMRKGGMSNNGITNLINKSWEDYRIIKNNKMPFPLLVLFLKNVSKIPQLLFKNRYKSS